MLIHLCSINDVSFCELVDVTCKDYRSATGMDTEAVTIRKKLQKNI